MSNQIEPGFAIWLTGLPSSGKTTLAHLLRRLLAERGIATQVLDSDGLRRRLTPEPTYSAQERDWFYDVITFLAELLTASGVNVLIAATASRRAYRQAAREQVVRLAEVYVDCPPEVCRTRDHKGLWERADQGKITTLPGAGAPYEPPESPEVHVDAGRTPPDESARQILRQLDAQGFFVHQRPPESAGEKENAQRSCAMFKKILLATDGSPDAAAALRYARDLAWRDEAMVVLVHAFEPVPRYLGDPWEERVTVRHIAGAREVASGAAQALQEAGVDVIVEVLEGPPADAILKVADVRACDLIVMGSRGHGALASLLLGSVSHRVLAHARIPVMVVRAIEGQDA
jgi:adenylylsulfate kinase